MATITPSVRPFANDVLLSFAEDMRPGFVGHLSRALQEAGFLTILLADPTQDLGRNAYEESMIFIVILSELYLLSQSHLDRLSQIVDFNQRRVRQCLLPVFYNVEPYDVLNRIGRYRNSVEPYKFQKWTEALTQVASSCRWCFRRDGGSYEYQIIEEMLPVVSEHVDSVTGLYISVHEVIQLLHSGSNPVHVIGICGDPGIGKRIARRVYDLIAGEGFDNYCFLDKVGENLEKPIFGHLLHMFFSGLVGNKYGMSITKGTLKQMKVFVVFPSINDSTLLKCVVELTSCFGSGSKVIITSQDKCLLESHGVKRVYQVERSVRYVNIVDHAETSVSVYPSTLEVTDSNTPGKIREEYMSALDQSERIQITDFVITDSNTPGKIREEYVSALDQSERIQITDFVMRNLARENKRQRLSEDFLEENKYSMQDAKPDSNDRGSNWELMESDYPDCSSSSSLDAL